MLRFLLVLAALYPAAYASSGDHGGLEGKWQMCARAEGQPSNCVLELRKLD